MFFFFKAKAAYSRRIRDWSSDGSSSDLDREAKQLVAQADAVQRDLLRQEFADRGDGVVARLRVAGAVGQEDAVGLERQRLGSGRLRRHHRDIATALGEHAQDGALDAVIVGEEPVFRARKSVVMGKSGSVTVDSGGRHSMKT